MPGPRNDFEDVLLALSKLDLKTNGNPSLQELQRHLRYQSFQDPPDRSLNNNRIFEKSKSKE